MAYLFVFFNHYITKDVFLLLCIVQPFCNIICEKSIFITKISYIRIVL